MSHCWPQDGVLLQEQSRRQRHQVAQGAKNRGGVGRSKPQPEVIAAPSARPRTRLTGSAIGTALIISSRQSKCSTSAGNPTGEIAFRSRRADRVEEACAKKVATSSQMERAWTISRGANRHGRGCQDHKQGREAMNAEGGFRGAFRCKNESHVADGDDGFDKQNDADRARAPNAMNASTVNPDAMSRTPLRRSHQTMLGPSSGSGRPKPRVAVIGLTTYLAPIAMIARARSSAVPSESQCITTSYLANKII